MPYAKKYRRRRTKAKKSYRRKRVDKNRQISDNVVQYRRSIGALAPLPRKLKTKLIYSEPFIVIDPGATGVVQVARFSANGLFDPNNTGGGHQPRGFDQLIAMYDHFVVIGSKMTCIFCPDNITVNAPGNVMGITLRDDTSEESTLDGYLESSYTVYDFLPQDASSKLKLIMPVNPNKFLGRSHPLSDSQLKGSVSANPAEQCFYHIWGAPPQSTDSNPVLVVVTIEYDVIFLEPVQPGQS